jgi:ABC-type dipeptide/oligopeptide/nickel transport system permease subunit
MISLGRDFVTVAWWLPTFPGLAILLTVLSINLVGDRLRDALDPRLRNRSRGARGARGRFRRTLKEIS